MIIGNVHLGTDDDILSSLAVMAEETKAQVIHTGNICTYTEKQMYERRINKLRTFESIGQERHQLKVDTLKRTIYALESDISDPKDSKKEAKKIDSKIKKLQKDLHKFSKRRKNTKESYDAATKAKVDSKKEELSKLKAELRKYQSDIDKNVRLLEKRDSLFNKLDLVVETNEAKREQMVSEARILATAEASRIEKLKRYFPNIKFVCNEEQRIKDHDEIIGDHLMLSKYLDVQSVNANGDRVTSQPITDRAFRYLKQQKRSVIMPHPSPALRSYEREGLNEAWNMYTTGSLISAGDPKRPSEFYKATHMPSALLVLIDPRTGEYHASRLHFDSIRCDFGHKQRPAILHDGMVYTGGGVVEVASRDCAVYSTDDHAPWEHTGVLAVTRSLIELHKAETFINGGDAADWTSLCPHNKNKPRAAENLRFNEDKKAFERLLKAQGESDLLKKRVLIDANHEFWLERYVDEHPEMEGIVDQKSVYNELIPNWEFHIPKNGEDYTYYFGDLAIRHGHKESISKAATLFTKYLGGHFHSHNEYLRCGSSGAGCRLGPSYLAGNLTKWQNCSTTITRYKGKTAFDIKSVLHDKKKNVSRFSYRGDIYEVPFHVYK